MNTQDKAQDKEMIRDPQLDAAYRAGAGAEPPQRLDDLIRAAARREVGSGPRSLASHRRWQMPLALAAVLVLSVGVVTTMREQGADQLDQPLPSSISSSGKTAGQNEAQPAAKAEALRQAEAPPLTTPAPATAPAPEPPAAAVAKRYEAPAVVEAPAALPPAQAPMMARSESAAVASTGAVAESRSTEAPAAAPRALMRAPASATADAARPGAPAVAMSAPPAPWQDLVGKPAEQWRQRILELRRAQRLSDAETVIAEFRRRFPDERLPEAGQP